MAENKIKLKVKSSNGVIKIKTLIKHPMETGLRKNKKTGKNYPANYITDLTVRVNDNVVVSSIIGAAISSNPYFQFRVYGVKGDTVTLSYIDSNGKSFSASAKSK